MAKQSSLGLWASFKILLWVKYREEVNQGWAHIVTRLLFGVFVLLPFLIAFLAPPGHSASQLPSHQSGISHLQLEQAGWEFTVGTLMAILTFGAPHISVSRHQAELLLPSPFYSPILFLFSIIKSGFVVFIAAFVGNDLFNVVFLSPTSNLIRSAVIAAIFLCLWMIYVTVSSRIGVLRLQTKRPPWIGKLLKGKGLLFFALATLVAGASLAQSQQLDVRFPASMYLSFPELKLLQETLSGNDLPISALLVFACGMLYLGISMTLPLVPQAQQTSAIFSILINETVVNRRSKGQARSSSSPNELVSVYASRQNRQRFFQLPKEIAEMKCAGEEGLRWYRLVLRLRKGWQNYYSSLAISTIFAFLGSALLAYITKSSDSPNVMVIFVIAAFRLRSADVASLTSRADLVRTLPFTGKKVILQTLRGFDFLKNSVLIAAASLGAIAAFQNLKLGIEVGLLVTTCLALFYTANIAMAFSNSPVFGLPRQFSELLEAIVLVLIPGVSGGLIFIHFEKVKMSGVGVLIDIASAFALSWLYIMIACNRYDKYEPNLHIQV